MITFCGETSITVDPELWKEFRKYAIDCDKGVRNPRGNDEEGTEGCCPFLGSYQIFIYFVPSSGNKDERICLTQRFDC